MGIQLHRDTPTQTDTDTLTRKTQLKSPTSQDPSLSHTEYRHTDKNSNYREIYTTVLLLQMKAREGDGNRNLINQKLLVSVFKSLSAYSA